MSRLLDKAIIAGLMVAIAFTALALGTVEAWSIAIFELITTVLLIFWAAKAIAERHFEIRIPSGALPLAAFVLIGLAQSLAFTGSDGHINTLSMDVEATRAAVVVIFFLFACYLIVANFFASRERLHTLANFLIIFGLALAVFALIQHFTWEGRLFWFRPAPRAGDGMGGPFVNRNHFAGYMEMLIPIPIALALSRALSSEARFLYGFAAAIMGIAEAASLSRGGIVSLIAALLFLTAVLMRINKRNETEARHNRLSLVGYPAVLMSLIVFAIIGGVFWVGADKGLAERLADVASSQGQSGSPGSRETIRAGAWTMFKANPILGVGVGAFQTVYPLYSQDTGSFLIEFAHNDYLQTLADGGIVTATLAVWFIIATFRDFARGLRLRDPLPRALTMGAGAGIFALLVHSLFDFNLQLPSNALLFLTLSASVATTGSLIADPHLRIHTSGVRIE